MHPDINHRVQTPNIDKKGNGKFTETFYYIFLVQVECARLENLFFSI